MLVLLAVLVATAAAVSGWYEWSYRPDRFSPADPLALAALASDDKVVVESGAWIVLRPRAGLHPTGLIFYPGGDVAPEGYAEPLRKIAEAGFLVVVVPMPLDLAVLGPNRATEVIEAFPAIHRWVLAGHSLGGAMAARFVYTHRDAVAGLLLWDAYPADTQDLSGLDIPVRQLMRVGADGQPPAPYLRTRHLLPASTEFVTLPGASHLGYGRFIAAPRFAGAEPGVVTGSMPIVEQHDRVAGASLDFLEAVEEH